MKKTLQQKSAKRTKPTLEAAVKEALGPTPPPARPPFRIDPLKITGICDDTGNDVIAHLLDEMITLLAVAFDMSDCAGELSNLISMAHRKASAAAELYHHVDEVRAATSKAVA